VNKVFNTDAPIFHALQASFRAVYGSQKGWEFVGIQGLAGLLVLVVAFVTCGLGAFLAVPVYCFYIQNAAYHKGVIS
jgi:ABC-type Na+ efflux pump permease subunit